MKKLILLFTIFFYSCEITDIFYTYENKEIIIDTTYHKYCEYNNTGDLIIINNLIDSVYFNAEYLYGETELITIYKNDTLKLINKPSGKIWTRFYYCYDVENDKWLDEYPIIILDTCQVYIIKISEIFNI